MSIDAQAVYIALSVFFGVFAAASIVTWCAALSLWANDIIKAWGPLIPLAFALVFAPLSVYFGVASVRLT